MQTQPLLQKTNGLLDKSFLIICGFYFASFWFFSFWVLKNNGVIWASPLGIGHHPFQLELFNTHFMESITYLFMQSPFYSVVTWLMLKINPVDQGFYAYLVLHYFMGFFALICLYKILLYLQIRKWLITLALSYFVFNPAFYLAFTSGWYDFLSMCLVSIMAYQFVRIIEQYSRKNLFYFLTSMTILVMYRSLFHPILFFIPVIIILTLVYRQHWRTILLYSLLPLLLTLAPYVKNYVIFDKFDVAAGSFGLAIRAPTYEYRSADALIDEIEKGRLSPLVLCYKEIKQPIIYKGQIYNEENCYKHIIPQFALSEAKSILDKKPYLAIPAILQGQNNLGFSDNYIPNSLTGLVIARQMGEDAKSYLFHHPYEYLDYVLINTSQLFRTNTTYHYLIANNYRHFPLWFGSRIFSFDFLKFSRPADVNKYGPFDTSYRPLILIGMLCAFTYAMLFAANAKRRKLLSVIHLLGLLVILFPVLTRYEHMHLMLSLQRSIVWSFMFIIPSAIAAIWVNLLKPLVQDDASRKMRIVLAFFVFVCIYFMTLVDLIPGSEQERYRFVVEGLIISLFLFWATNMLVRLSSVIRSRMRVGSDGSSRI